MKKPDFVETCEFLKLDDQKVLEKQTKIKEELQSEIRLFERRSFSTYLFVIKNLQKVLPARFKINRFPINIYVIAPIILLALFISSLVLSTPIFIKLLSSSALLAATVIVAYKNYNSLLKESEEIAVLDEKYLTLKTGQKVNWKEILIVYLCFKFSRSPKLIIQKLFDSDAVEIDLRNTIGPYLILHIVEAYRKLA